MKFKLPLGLAIWLSLMAGVVVAQIVDPVPEPSRLNEIWRLIALFVGPVLPILGNLLLRMPIVPNKIIPLVNMIVSTISKYWLMAGFGTLGEVAVGNGSGPLFAAINWGGMLGMIIPPLWGTLDSFLASKFYESRRAIAKVAGTTAWLERGKKSRW